MRYYTPYFNGKILNCTNDLDCPSPNAICLSPKKASWLNATTKVCACPSFVGLKGETCEELNDPAWFVFVCNLIGILLCLYAVYLVCNVIKTWKKRKIVWRNDAAHTTFVLAGISTLGYCAYFPMALSLPFHEFTVITRPGNVLGRTTPYLQAQNTLLAFILFFGMASLINLSVAWLMVAKRIRNKNRKTIEYNLAWIYVFVAFTYLFGFLITLIVFISFSMTQYAGYLVLPGVYFIACAFYLTAWRVKKMMRSQSLSSIKIENSMNLITKASLKIALLMTMTSVLLTCLVVLGNRYDANPPNKLYQGCIVAVAEVLFITSHTQIFQYLLSSSLNAMSVKTKSDSSSSKSPLALQQQQQQQQMQQRRQPNRVANLIHLEEHQEEEEIVVEKETRGLTQT